MAQAALDAAVREAKSLGLGRDAVEATLERVLERLVSPRPLRERMRDNLIAIRGLTKRYGTFEAVTDLTLEIEQGSICGLLGPNGAGKLDHIQMFARPGASYVGHDRSRGQAAGRSNVSNLGFVPERPALFGNLAAQHLELNRRLYTKYDAKRANELIDLFKLDRNKRAKRLSKKVSKTALSLVLAFSFRPEILVLDEPASGLDRSSSAPRSTSSSRPQPTARRSSSRRIRSGKSSAPRIASRFSSKAAWFSTATSNAQGPGESRRGDLRRKRPDSNGLIDDPRVRRVERTGRILRLYVRGDGDDFVRRLQALNPRSVDVLDLNLEDIFLGAVGEHARTLVESFNGVYRVSPDAQASRIVSILVALLGLLVVVASAGHTHVEVNGSEKSLAAVVPGLPLSLFLGIAGFITSILAAFLASLNSLSTRCRAFGRNRFRANAWRLRSSGWTTRPRRLLRRVHGDHAGRPGRNRRDRQALRRLVGAGDCFLGHRHVVYGVRKR